MKHLIVSCPLLLGLMTSMMASSPLNAADLIPSVSRPPLVPGGTTPNTPPSSPGGFVPPGPSDCPSGVRYVEGEDGLWYTTSQFAAAMRGDDSIVGQETLTPAQQRCTSTPPGYGFTPPPPGPPTHGGTCPPAQRYVYVDDALGYLTVAQRDEAMRTGNIPDGLQSIPASGCAPNSTPPSGPPTQGGTCPRAQRYVYVDDALGYLTVAQRDEAMRTGIIRDGLQSIPASGCAPTSTPPLTANPPSGGYCPPSRQYVYNDDALGYISLV